MRKINKVLVLAASFLLLAGCDESHSIPDNFFKDKNWTVWKSEDNSVAIYVASSYGAKNGVWISNSNGNNEKYLANMDSYVGISGMNRPWELKLTNTVDNSFQRKYDCKRVKKDKNDSASKFAIETETESIVLKAFEWKETEIDINCLKSIGCEELNLYCSVSIDPADYSNGYCLKGTYLEESLLIKGESEKSFVISYKNLEATGHYARKGNILDFQFDKNEIFDNLTHLEFNC